jgi:hypothetical protein
MQTKGVRMRGLPVGALAVFVVLGACSSSKSEMLSVELSGAVQKGPFLLGSSVDVALVDGQGQPTGKVYQTYTINDLGEFGLSFQADRYVSLTGTGFYYNEVTGQISGANLTLRAFLEVTEAGAQAAYLNVITHLWYNRIRRLLAGGVPFAQAASVTLTVNRRG